MAVKFRTQADARSLGESFDISAETAKRNAYNAHDFAAQTTSLDMAQAENRDGNYYAALGELLLERMRKLQLNGENPYFDQYNRLLYQQMREAGYEMNVNSEFNPQYFEMSGDSFGAGPALQTDYVAQGMPTQRGGLAYEDPEGRFRVSLENGEYTDDEWDAAIQKAIRDYEIYGTHGSYSMGVETRQPARKQASGRTHWRALNPYEQSDYDVNAYMQQNGLSSAALSNDMSNERQAYLDALDAYVRGAQANGGYGTSYAAASGQNVLIGGGASNQQYAQYVRDIADREGRYRNITSKRSYY